MRLALRTNVERAFPLALAAGLIAWPAVAQVPPPRDISTQANELREARRAIELRESRALAAIAEKAAKSGDREATAAIKRWLPAASTADGPSRFTPLPEIVARSPQGLASVKSESPKPDKAEGTSSWRAELEAARKQAARELFELAKRAATQSPPRYGEAALCLRLVLERDPDHAEARRLVGYVPFQGGWARPFAVRQLKAGYVNHAVFGWVPTDWVTHLEAGELPAPASRGSRAVRWLPIDEADRLRAGWKPPWQITTEHFEIQTNVPLGEAIEFGRRLEAFHDVFFTLMADVVGENLPLARRFRSSTTAPDASYRPHQVLYFATKEQYVDRLRTTMGPDANESLGYYNPPKPGTGNRRSDLLFSGLRRTSPGHGDPLSRGLAPAPL